MGGLWVETKEAGYVLYVRGAVVLSGSEVVNYVCKYVETRGDWVGLD